MVRKYLLRAAIALALCLPCAARAQLLTVGVGCSSVSASCQSTAVAAAYVGPGDVASAVGVAAWWGLRAYNASIAAAASQAAVNLSRASDSHTCDIAVATNGGLGVTKNCSTGGDNGTAVATWCNGTTCSATEMYDQTPGSIFCNGGAGPCNVTQATAADQPTFTFNCASTGKPCLNGNGTSYELPAATNWAFSQAQPITLVSEADATTATNAVYLKWNDSSGANNSLGNSLYGCFGGSTSATVTASNNTAHSLISVANGASSILVVDGSANGSKTCGNGGLAASSGFRLVGDSPDSQWLTGFFFEGGVWKAAFTATVYGNMATNMASYY